MQERKRATSLSSGGIGVEAREEEEAAASMADWKTSSEYQGARRRERGWRGENEEEDMEADLEVT